MSHRPLANLVLKESLLWLSAFLDIIGLSLRTVFIKKRRPLPNLSFLSQIVEKWLQLRYIIQYINVGCSLDFITSFSFFTYT